jgi:LPXTG-site transpeptidase (sortase) family protein|tara:strand:- start:34072 stop:34629 length:558 start_codon:yes stop_codon:yes gene_type:complete
MVFSVTFTLLGTIGLTPEFKENIVLAHESPEKSSVQSFELPKRIVIHEIGVEVAIESPESMSISVLDEALARGAVHYPGSGLLGEDSNVFLFGHSSYLPSVKNKAYQAFNGIQKLDAGDVVKVFSDNREYRYIVRDVRLSDATDALVEFETGSSKLTLSTCNSFGSKTDRFVVEADFVGSYPIVI